MHKIVIGTQSESVTLHLPRTAKANEWHNAFIEVSVQGFHGAISIAIETADVLRFQKELFALHNSLKGKATFSHIEDQFRMNIEVNQLGHITVEGHAWAFPCYGSKLDYTFDIDQTYLSDPISELLQFEKACA